MTLIQTRTIDDRLERDGVRRVVWLLLGGLLVFDLALYDALAPVGICSTDAS